MTGYAHRRVPERRAVICARFLHPVTDAPMVTWHQTSDLRGEKPEFYTTSEREFHSWFRPLGEE